MYRSFIEEKLGEDIFCIKTRSSAKASGKKIGEVHGANKPLDPNYKPEHQSKSKLPSVTGKSSPVRTPSKPILKMPSRPTPKALITPKSVTIHPEKMDEMPAPILNPTLIGMPVTAHEGARPKTQEWMKHPYYLPLLPLLLLNHSSWYLEESFLLHHQERMGRM